MDNVRDRTVLITGAAKGLGYNFAEELLRNGAKCVAIVDLATSDGQNAANTLEKAYGKGRALFHACDVTEADDFARTFHRIAVETFRGLDILINNAGVLDERYVEQTVDINLTALIRASYLAIDHMGNHKGGKGGTIVNIASIYGLSAGNYAPSYTATKHAVVGFSKSLANYHDVTGVRIVILCPGVTFTAMIENIDEKLPDFAKYSKWAGKALGELPSQTTDNVARAMIDLVQRGDNGAAWVSEGGEPPYAVDFIHYSKRSLPV